MNNMNSRTGVVERKTRETEIRLELIVDGSGKCSIDSGVPFLDHMLTLFAVHGFFDLNLTAKGDTEVDDHHTVEDIGICLGQAFSMALADKAGISRYGSCYLPMDEALVRLVVDMSNRPYLHYQVALDDQKVGTFDTCLCKEFLRAFSLHAGMTLHVDMIHGENAHHIIEAVFKGLAKAVHQASRLAEHVRGALSSKGCL